MRADRLLSLVLLLRHRGRATAAVLARELEVSERTVLRDVEALSAAGIPVYAERGRHGGFALLPGFTTDLTGLTPAEAVALLGSGATSTPGALGLGTEFASAMRKIVAALPDAAREQATDAAGRVLVRRGGWLRDTDDGATTDVLTAVQRAVFGGVRLRIRYRAGTRPGAEPGPAAERVVDPVGLVQAAGRWYLLALRDGEDRTYRVSRIEEAEPLAEPAHRPEGVTWRSCGCAVARTSGRGGPGSGSGSRCPPTAGRCCPPSPSTRRSGPGTGRPRWSPRSGTSPTPDGRCGRSCRTCGCWTRRSW